MNTASNPIKKLYAWVHPGYSAFARSQVTDAAREMYSKIRDKFRGPPDGAEDSAMVVLHAVCEKEYLAYAGGQDRETYGEVMNAIADIATAFKGRYLAMHAAAAFITAKTVNVPGILEWFQSQGMPLDARTELVAFGETKQRCVPDAARIFLREGPFKQATVDLSLTNVYGNNLDEYREGGEALALLRRDHPELVFKALDGERSPSG